MSCNELGLALGQIISRTRVEQGKTQQEVADGIGVKRETVNQWETGTRQLKAEHIIKLSKFFNVSADYILGLRDTQSSDPTLQSAVNYTGLSEMAVDALSSAMNSNNVIVERYKKDAFNLFIQSFSFSFMCSVGDLKKAVDSAFLKLGEIEDKRDNGGYISIELLNSALSLRDKLDISKFRFLESCRDISEYFRIGDAQDEASSLINELVFSAFEEAQYGEHQED